MNESKQIDVNFASIVDLKAELYRKQESFRLKKLSQTQRQVIENNESLYSINSNQIKYKLGKRIREKGVKEVAINKGRRLVSNEDNERKREEQIEEEKALKKSKQMLEMKSKLYDKWSQNPNLLNSRDNEDIDEEVDERILVDFSRKAVEEREQIRHRNDVSVMSSDNEDIDDKSGVKEDTEEWTEFVDSLGRSRKCLKKDLQYFEDIDRKTFHSNRSNDNKSEVSSVPQLSANNELLSDDLRRELERREWEGKAIDDLKSESQSNPKDIHYQNVQHNEIRDHGVAYYAFAKDQYTRQQQMDVLNQLRDQTKTGKQQKQKLKQKRKQLIRERLAKVAQRKGISLPIQESSSDSDEEIIEVRPPEPEPRPAPTSVREWDVGKKDLHEFIPSLPQKQKSSQNSYVEERRVERVAEFAPPLSYSENRFKNKRNDFKPKETLFGQNSTKTSNISQNYCVINDKTKGFANNESDIQTPEPDVNQMIGNALSYLRSHSK